MYRSITITTNQVTHIMAHRIFKQPNGKLCLFSTVVDDFIAYDLSKEDIVNIWLESLKHHLKEDVDKAVKELEGQDTDELLKDKIAFIEAVHNKTVANQAKQKLNIK